MASTPDVQQRNIVSLLCDFNTGIMRIPDFQRAFVWGRDEVLELLDSINNGYPIGSFLIWKTTERLAERNPASLHLQSPQENSELDYLLDGQQRLVTIYAILTNSLQIGVKKIKYRIFYDLVNKKFLLTKKSDRQEMLNMESNINIIPADHIAQIDWISRTSNINSNAVNRFRHEQDFTNLFMTFSQIYDKITKIIIPTIVVSQNLRIASTIFERTNTTGSPLTIVDLMVAKTYRTDFNLRNKLKEIRDDFERGGFDLTDRTILQCFSACLQHGVSGDNILDSYDSIQNQWNLVIANLRKATDFLKNSLSIPNSNFLPYEIMLAPLTFFFFDRADNRSLDNDTIKSLKKYFWRIGITDNYIEGQNTKVKKHIEEMHTLKQNSTANVFEIPVDEFTIQKIKDTEFTVQSAFCKTVLCMLANQRPLNLSNSQPIDLRLNFSSLNNKSVHHIFPKDFVERTFSSRTNYDEEIKPYKNSLANIALLTIAENSHILSRAPSDYFDEFERTNHNFDVALKSHVIENLDNCGIRQDNFLKFLDNRTKQIYDKLKALL